MNSRQSLWKTSSMILIGSSQPPLTRFGSQAYSCRNEGVCSRWVYGAEPGSYSARLIVVVGDDVSWGWPVVRTTQQWARQPPMVGWRDAPFIVRLKRLILLHPAQPDLSTGQQDRKLDDVATIGAARRSNLDISMPSVKCRRPRKAYVCYAGAQIIITGASS